MDPNDQTAVEELASIARLEFVKNRGREEYGAAARPRIAQGTHGLIFEFIDGFFTPLQVIARWDYQPDAPMEKRLSNIAVFSNGKRRWPDEQYQMSPLT